MRDLPAIALAAAVAGCSGPGGPSPAGTLSYGFPSPPNAAYEIADTVTVEMHRPGGNLEFAGGYLMTLNLLFEQDLTGIRVTGIARDFEGSISNPLQPTRFGDIGYLSNTLEFVMNRRGVTKVVSFPELSGSPAQLFSFAGLVFDIFPPLPDEAVDAGGSWVDTVIWHADGMEMERTFTGAYTYTLVGDTVLDGRRLVHIAFPGEMETDDAIGMPRTLTWRDLNGPVTGFLLWDPERRLVAYQEYERDLKGTVTLPDRPSTGTSLTGSVRIRLVK